MLSIRVSIYFAGLFLFLCLNSFVTGGCLNYGHSCWGGHGKRSANGLHGGLASRGRTSDWYLTRLLQAQRAPPFPDQRVAMDINNIFGPENVIRDSESLPFSVMPLLGSSPNRQRVSGESESEESEGWSTDTNDSAADLVVVSPEDSGTPQLHLYQLLNDASFRKNSVG